MVPFTIFHRLSSLGSGGGVKAGTIPPGCGYLARNKYPYAPLSVWSCFTVSGGRSSVTTVTAPEQSPNVLHDHVLRNEEAASRTASLGTSRAREVGLKSRKGR